MQDDELLAGPGPCKGSYFLQGTHTLFEVMMPHLHAARPSVRMRCVYVCRVGSVNTIQARDIIKAQHGRDIMLLASLRVQQQLHHKIVGICLLQAAQAAICVTVSASHMQWLVALAWCPASVDTAAAAAELEGNQRHQYTACTTRITSPTKRPCHTSAAWCIQGPLEDHCLVARTPIAATAALPQQ
jgi:hypothetical protein